jgi:hypothetical protein
VSFVNDYFSRFTRHSLTKCFYFVLHVSEEKIFSKIKLNKSMTGHISLGSELLHRALISNEKLWSDIEGGASLMELKNKLYFKLPD